MKTFKFTNLAHIQNITRLTKRLVLSVLLLLSAICPGMAQGQLSGYVVDEEFNEPLVKAVVTIPGTLISVLTDQQGKFSIKLVSGDYLLEINYPGYYPKTYNMGVSEGIFTPMFVIKLKANAIGRTIQRRITSFETKKQFPQSLENLSTWEVSEQTGNQEFNEALRTIPSVNVLSNGSGFNDSEIGFRGNDPTRTTYTFNGILLNNPETGRVGSSMLSGLTDWAGQIQVVSGQAANMQSRTSSGGLVNVLSIAPHEKAGADLLAVYGNEGMLKTSATVHSGHSKNGFASSVQLSRTAGNGLVQNTAFEQYGFLVNIQKEFNHRNTLVLNLNGILQQHDRNMPDSIATYIRYGTKYNRQWGQLDGKPMSWSTNYGRSPMISLTHFWQPRIKTYISTQIHAQFNRSAQLLPGGSFNNQTLDVLPRDSTGLISFDKITDWNKGLEVAEMGTTRTPDTNGKFINSENSGISTLAAIDSETRLGLRSVVTHNLSKELNINGSFSLENYHASHFGSVYNLLGADSYTSFSNINIPAGYEVQNLFQSNYFTSYNSADKTSYSYESDIQSAGISVRANYHQERLSLYLEGSGLMQNIRRTDHFNYLTTDNDRETEFLVLPGGHIQSGLRIDFWKYHSVHLRANYGSSQPLFAQLFPSGNNWKNEQVKNEQVFDAEFGYTIYSRKLKVEALVYRSMITNRSMVRRANLDPGDSYGLVNGLAELHQGVELKTAIKIRKNLQLKINGSLGDWKYTKDAKAQLYDPDRLQTSENELWLKDVQIANAPQFSLFAEFEYRWAHNFYVRLNYYRADQLYAPFNLYDFKDLADRSDFEQWQLPVFDLLGASGNYMRKIGKSTVNLIFGAQNLLDTEYIEQSATNLNEENSLFTSNQVYYGMGRTWFAGIKIQF